MTGLVMNAIKSIQEFIKETSIKAIAMYQKVDKVYKYLKSIPKKVRFVDSFISPSSSPYLDYSYKV